MMGRNYARDLARKTGHLEALDFIDVAEERQLEDLVSHFEAESKQTTCCIVLIEDADIVSASFYVP